MEENYEEQEERGGNAGAMFALGLLFGAGLVLLAQKIAKRGRKSMEDQVKQIAERQAARHRAVYSEADLDAAMATLDDNELASFVNWCLALERNDENELRRQFEIAKGSWGRKVKTWPNVGQWDNILLPG